MILDTTDYYANVNRDNDRARPPYVLVTCPTYDGKAYCFDRWVEMARSLDYSNYSILAVDNSETPEFYEKYKTRIPMLRRERVEGEKDDAMYRVCQSMGVIRDYFLARPFDYWMNIEADVIPPANIIKLLMSLARQINADWVQHCYPNDSRLVNPSLMQGIGCALFSRRLMCDFNWSDPTIADDSPDSELWYWVQAHPVYRTVECWYCADVEHLK